MHTLICVTFSLPPGVRGRLRLLLVASPGLFCLLFCVFYYGAFRVESCLSLWPRVFQSYLASLVKRDFRLCASRACLFILHTSVSVLFLSLLVSEIGCALWLWLSLDFSIIFFFAETNSAELGLVILSFMIMWPGDTFKQGHHKRKNEGPICDMSERNIESDVQPHTHTHTHTHTHVDFWSNLYLTYQF